jgi:hypothetical protein
VIGKVGIPSQKTKRFIQNKRCLGCGKNHYTHKFGNIRAIEETVH